MEASPTPNLLLRLSFMLRLERAEHEGFLGYRFSVNCNTLVHCRPFLGVEFGLSR